VRELQALVAPKAPHGVLVRGHAGLVITKLSLSLSLFLSFSLSRSLSHAASDRPEHGVFARKGMAAGEPVGEYVGIVHVTRGRAG